MTNRITDGFDWCPTTMSGFLWSANGFFKVNPIAGIASNTTGRFNFGKAISWVYTPGGADAFFGQPNGYVVPFGLNISTVFIGGAVKVGSATGLNVAMIGCFDAVTGAHQVCVTFNSYGIMKVWRGRPEDGTLLASSAVGSFLNDEWFHFEAKFVIASTGGTVECRINTETKVSLVGANTQNTSVASADSAFIGVNQGALNSPASFLLDDFFVNDTAGSVNNTWLGNVRVKTQAVIANGPTQNFSIGGTSPAATNWQSVLNNLLTDAQYVYSPTVGNYDLYQLDPNLNSPLVHVLQVRAAARQDDATQRAIKHKLKIGATEYDGSIDHYLNQTYTMYRTRWETNPATGVSFTGTEVNGLYAGVKISV